MNGFIEQIKITVRGIMLEVAKLLDLLTNRKIRPNHITFVSLAGHIVLFLALTEGRFPESALLLVFFGLLDSVDGQLARFQKTESSFGMLLDSTTDRLKEMIIYAGLAFWFTEHNNTMGVLYCVLALGISLSVSYIRARGEALLLASKKSMSKKQINKVFTAGMFSYEMRMFILVVGFILNEPLMAVATVTVGSSITFIQRFLQVNQALNDKN